VTVGGSPCEAVQWVSDSLLTCTPLTDLPIGSHDLVVTVHNQRSQPVGVAALCPEGSFGLAGQQCVACPDGALCAGRGADPVARQGFYPLTRATFVECVPSAACRCVLLRCTCIVHTHTHPSKPGCGAIWSLWWCSLRLFSCVVGVWGLVWKLATGKWAIIAVSHMHKTKGTLVFQRR
jgi:hypothetical protein